MKTSGASSRAAASIAASTMSRLIGPTPNSVNGAPPVTPSAYSSDSAVIVLSLLMFQLSDHCGGRARDRWSGGSTPRPRASRLQGGSRHGQHRSGHGAEAEASGEPPRFD